MQKTSHPMEPAEMMAYLDGELPVDRAAAAATHLERCPECQALATDMRMVSQSLLAWQVESSEVAAPPLPEAREVRTWRLRPWAWGLVGVGAAVVLVGIVLPRMNRPATVADFVSPAPRPMDLFRGGVSSSDQPLAPSPVGKPDVAVPATATAGKLEPMVARTAALNLSTREFDRIRPAVDGVIQRHNGYLASLNITAPAGAPRSLNAVLRIPAPGLAAALDELKKLGRVESEEQSGEEVGEQYRDLAARLANARTAEQRLADILRQRTGKLSDVLDVERELDRVRGEIESMDAQRKGLAKRVDYATLNLTVSEVYQERLEVVPDPTFARIRNAAVAGYRNMAGGLVAVVLFIIAAAPTVLLWTALLFFPARYAWRRWR